MGKPAILAVDDDQLVLAAIARDLRRQYSDDYQVIAASSGPEALGVLNELAARGDATALLVVDQRMPEMTGVEFLEASRRLDESTRRVLLTGYADIDAAIASINLAGVSFYIQKPWEPPEERLYPLLDELLDDWRATYRPPFSGVRVLGDRFHLDTQRIRGFLARNLIPYQSIEAGGTEGQMLLSALGVTPAELPVVLLEDGTRLARPEPQALAEAVHLQTRSQPDTYDLVIVGAGPAGLAAAVYAASEGLEVLAVEEDAPGGQAGQSSRIENYLGFPAGLSGSELTRRAVAQAARFKAETVVPVEASSLARNDPFRLVGFSDGRVVNSRAVLITTGVSYRTLELPGAEELTGHGIFYGASPLEVADARGEDVAVIGGGNSAGQAALYLAAHARKVYVVVRGKSLSHSMSAYLNERLQAADNIDILTTTELVKALGDPRLESLTVRHDGVEFEIDVQAAFVFIGQAPRVGWLNGQVETDNAGFILSGLDCTSSSAWTVNRPRLPLETSVFGVFAAGDVRSGSIKRIASAAGEGAMAVSLVHRHLEGL